MLYKSKVLKSLVYEKLFNIIIYLYSMNRISTIICLRWKVTGSVEHFSNLRKMYDKYNTDILGVSKFTLNKKDLYSGYENKEIEVIKSYIQ